MIKTDLSIPSSVGVSTALGLALLFASPIAANSATFTIRPIEFLTGPTSMVATGTITTAGASSAITDWNLTVTTTELLAHYTRANTVNLSSGVTAEGGGLYVATSPDGVSDGGALFFRSPSPFADFGAAVANFTSPFLPGGQAFYTAGATFDFLGLNQGDGATYRTATVRPTDPKVYDLTPLEFSGGVTMTGSIATDGKTGTLGAADITSWDISVEQVSQDVFNRTNSSLLSDQVALSPDGQDLTVNNPGGYLTFLKGYPGGHPYALSLADFTDPYAPYGQAGYFQGRLAVNTIPLNAPYGPWSVSGSAPIAVPEPATLSLLGLAFAGVLGNGAVRRRFSPSATDRAA